MGLRAALLATASIAFVAALLAEPVVHRESNPGIYAGREDRVRRLLAPLLDRGFLGLRVSGVGIRGAEIEIGLDSADPARRCAAPDGSMTAGKLSLSHGTTLGDPETSAVANGLELSWSLCEAGVLPASAVADAAGELVRELAGRHDETIWGIEGLHEVAPGQSYGLLTPVMRWTGLQGRLIAVLVVVFGWVGAVVAARTVGEVDTPDASAPVVGSGRVTHGVRLGLVVLVLALAVHLRGLELFQAPVEVDERWAFPSPHSAFSGDHDAWVHPPLFRALAQAWTTTIGWLEATSSMAWLRGPSLVAELLAVCLVARRFMRRASPLWGCVTLIPLALGADVVHSSILARPYGLSLLFVVIAGDCLWFASAPRQFEIALALVAAGLATWTDLLSGVAAWCVVASFVVDRALRARGVRLRGAAALSLVAAIWLAPLLPGAWAARRGHVVEASAGAAEAADLRSRRGTVGTATSVVGLMLVGDERSGAAFWLAPGVAAGLVGLSLRRRSVVPLVPMLLGLMLVGIGSAVELRPRNAAVLPYLLALAVAARGSAERRVR